MHGNINHMDMLLYAQLMCYLGDCYRQLICVLFCGKSMLILDAINTLGVAGMQLWYKNISNDFIFQRQSGKAVFWMLSI
jgi:hypothetical protein